MPLRLVKIFAGLLAGIGLFALLFRCAGRSSYDLRREALARDCAAFRAHHHTAVCGPDVKTEPLMPSFKIADAAVNDARVYFLFGDVERGRRSLGRALSIADTLEDRGTLLGSLLSAKIVDRLLDAIEVSTLGDRDIVALFARRKPANVSAVLEGERLFRLSAFAELPVAFRVPTGPFGRAVASDVMRTTDRRLNAMASSLAMGDLEGCKRTARAPHPFGSPSGLDEVFCEKLSQVKATSARLEKVRGGALARLR